MSQGVDVAGSATANGADAPASRAAGPPRSPNLRRRPLRVGARLRRGDRPARPVVDLSPPGPLRTDHVDGRRAPVLARPVCSCLARGGPMSEAILNQLRDVVQ